MPHYMVPECTNNSRQTVGISYHRIPKEKGLREAWLARIRRVNPRDINNSCLVRRILHQTASKERSILCLATKKGQSKSQTRCHLYFRAVSQKKLEAQGEEEIKSALNKPDRAII